MRMKFFENRYGKQRFSDHNIICTGYYRYEIKIFNDGLKEKLNLKDFKKFFYIYDIVSIDEMDRLLGMHWLQENYSTENISGKIKTCEKQDYEANLQNFYCLIIKVLSDDWGFVEGEDFCVFELGYIKLKPAIEFYNNYWLVDNGVFLFETIHNDYRKKMDDKCIL